ncbi:MAG: lysophospholipid acyltransferase family protein [Gammaproteobacteria bacterium]|nr:lysophospholipid acyltransferase family protein [Gammaproteobacteria bacterium]
MSKPELDPQFKSYLSDKPNLTYAKDEDGRFRRAIIRTLEVVFGRRKIERIYHDLKKKEFDLKTFFEEAIERSGLEIHKHGYELAQLDSSGPLILLANHPFGIVDGLVFCDLAIKQRGDFRIMINAVLCQDEKLAPYFLPVDFESTKQAMKTNIRSKQLALQSLSNNVPLLIFPSGMVSTAGRMGFGEVRDGQWTTFAAKLVREAKATVVPVYFHGKNSRKFHIVSHLSEPLRMGLLMHEAINKFGRQINVTIGEPIRWSEKLSCLSRQELTEYLYNSVSRLRDPKKLKIRKKPKTRKKKQIDKEPSPYR